MKRPNFIKQLNELKAIASFRLLSYEEACKKSELQQRANEYYKKVNK